LAIFMIGKILEQTLDAKLDSFEVVRGQYAPFGVDDS